MHQTMAADTPALEERSTAAHGEARDGLTKDFDGECTVLVSESQHAMIATGLHRSTACPDRLNAGSRDHN